METRVRETRQLESVGYPQLAARITEAKAKAPQHRQEVVGIAYGHAIYIAAPTAQEQVRSASIITGRQEV